jgi:hypothetical protein
VEKISPMRAGGETEENFLLAKISMNMVVLYTSLWLVMHNDGPD